MVGSSDGAAAAQFRCVEPGPPATLDPGLAEADVSTFNEITTFSSRGPVTGNAALKPDLVAVGTDMYMATETYDPEGEMYDATGYTVQDGTSFSTPMVAGGIALVKQRNPGFTPAQLKSAVVNTATQDVTEDGDTAGVTAVGGGKLDAGKAVQTTVTVEPASLSFGDVGSAALPVAQRLTITNTGDGRDDPDAGSPACHARYAGPAYVGPGQSRAGRGPVRECDGDVGRQHTTAGLL